MAVTDTLRQLRQSFKSSTMMMKIIWLNIVIFIFLRLAAIASIFWGNPDFINTVLSYLQLPSDPHVLLTRPWTIASYMFTQYDVMHILFNMLWLYWFGSLFTMVATQRQFFTLYLLGGLGGGAMFMLGYNLLPAFDHHYGMLIGSSASVIAIVTATAILMPHFKMNLLFIGSVSLKWIAIATIVLVLIGATGNNAGGEIAHLGGVAIGTIYALRLKKGHDITAPFNHTFDRMANIWNRFASMICGTFSMKKCSGTRHTASGSNTRKTNGTPLSRNDREDLDAILDKIKKSGYSALSPEERQRLFDVSKKIK